MRLHVKTGHAEQPFTCSVCQLQFKRNDGRQVVEELNNTLEEADLRIVPHVHWAVQHGARRELSNDTDVVVLLIRFAPTWMCQGTVLFYNVN